MNYFNLKFILILIYLKLTFKSNYFHFFYKYIKIQNVNKLY